MAGHNSRGFTLVEMMIVVIIVGLLATLAVVGYRKLINASHVSEATHMVQNIRLAQEAYHSETQQYANVSKTLTSWYPATSKYQYVTAWGGDCSNCTVTTWVALPLHVDGPVRFGYATVAGPANTPLSTNQLTVDGQKVTLLATANSPTDWYEIAAEGDLDGDPTTTTDVYGLSFTNQIFVSNEGQ